jgi:hypothetical protein
MAEIQQEKIFKDLMRQLEAARTVAEVDNLSSLFGSLTGVDRAAALEKIAKKRDRLARDGKHGR